MGFDRRLVRAVWIAWAVGLIPCLCLAEPVMDQADREVQVPSHPERIVSGPWLLRHPAPWTCRSLARARELCDFLAVTVTPDAYVNKGPQRPVFSADQRAEVLAALSMVNAVAVNRWTTAEQTLRLLAPDIYVKGAEYERDASDPASAITLEVAACEKAGGRTVFIDEMVFSSSSLANRFYAPLFRG